MPYYTHSGYPAQSAPGASGDARTEFDAIAAGFALIAPYTGYGGRIVRINAGGTAQESVTLATATIESYTDAQAGTHSNLTTVAGTNTITATATPTLLAYVTNQSFRFPAAGANTGATTIAIDGLAVKNLVRPDGTALLSGDIPAAGYICDITIRAADAVLNNPATTKASQTVISVTGATGNIAGQAGTVASVTGAAGNIAGQAGTVASVTGAAGNIAGSSGSCTGAAATVTGSATVSGAISSSSPTAGIGYATGAGGAVTQITSLSTPVTLNKMSGSITTVAHNFANGSGIAFQFVNSNIAVNDVIVVSVQNAGGLAGGGVAAHVVQVSAGSCYLSLLAVDPSYAIGTLTATINFAVIKAVNA